MHSHAIRISGIQVRNLKNISVEFNPREIVLFTGLSGSGKTSLAFDTINALGIHRYLSTVPSFLAQACVHLPEPVVEACVGLSPTLAVQQNYFSHNTRTTVGTTSQISHYLSLLFALDGEIVDPNTKQSLRLTNKEYIIAFLLSLPEQTQLTFLAPIVHKTPAHIQQYIRDGYTKIRIHDSIQSIYAFISTGIPQQTPAYIIIDTCIKNVSNQARLKVSLFAALELGNGQCSIMIDEKEQTFTTYAGNSSTNQSIPSLTFQDFSPHGFQTRCHACQGSGLTVRITSPSLIQPHKSIIENNFSFIKTTSSTFYKNLYHSFADHFQFDINTPWEHLSQEIQHAFLYGKGYLSLPISLFDPSLGKKTTSYKIWKGALNELGEKIRYSTNPHKYIPPGIATETCTQCKGTGLGPLAVSATWNHRYYDELQNMSFSHIYDILNNSSPSPIIQDIVQALLFRLSIFIDLGLSYLTPSRSLSTLSGGEQERTALAKHIGTNLKGITYVLDEPSIGLHPRDIEKLTQVILKLRDQGNTILLVEHEDSMLSIANRVIDIGPGAGIFGGTIQFNGSPKEFLQKSNSLTAQYLRREKTLSLPPKQLKPTSFLSLKNANIHNLKDVSISFPLGRITAVTGVSGSGKSSLINEWLIPQLELYLETNHSPYVHISNGSLSHLVHVSRDLPHKTQRSIPLTYMKAFDALRLLFADLPKSRQFGFTKSHFSFNLPIGACLECKGLGWISNNDFTHIQCPTCNGQRFQPQILEIRYHDKTISDILDMTALEGAKFFQDEPKLYEPIRALCSLGLDYLPLGRPLFSLSGGEIQKLKLAYEFLYPRKNPTLYVLDEPSIGLHTHDLQALINTFSTLIQNQHTVVIIEHNMHLVQAADHIIELGPEGGEQGGELLACCPIEQFIKKNTYTAQALRPYVENTVPLPSIQSFPIPKPTHAINIYDAYQGTLKHINLSIPNYALSVITGPSASGKHTLLFDVLYAYGNITYTEILPPYLRQILIKKTPNPKVKVIQGLAPVIAIRNISKPTQSRLHLAYALDITSQLESLFVMYGQPYAPDTGEALRKITPENIAHYLVKKYNQKYLTVTVPIAPYEDLSLFIQEKQQKGFVKLFANGIFYDLEDSLPHQLHHPALVIQHIRAIESNQTHLQSALSLAFSFSQQTQILIHTDDSIRTCLFPAEGWFDSKGGAYPILTKKMFSPYHAEGRCQTCQGSGEFSSLILQQQDPVLHNYTPLKLFQELCPQAPLQPLYSLLEKLQLSHTDTFASMSFEDFSALCTGQFPFVGLESLLAQHAKNLNLHSHLQSLISLDTCPNCSGTGIHSYARHVRIHNLSIIDLYTQEVSSLQTFLSSWNTNPIPVVQDIQTKLLFLHKVGLSYVCLGQKQYTLSCGEIYRLHLAKKLSSQLTDVVYLLEDPLSGLHRHDQTILSKLLQEIVAQGNTVIASDRTQQLIPYAHHTIYLGPGSGPQGGNIISKQEFAPIDINKIQIPPKTNKKKPLSIHFSAHFCKNMQITLPLHALTTIIGVSGSGKTTLLKEGIYKKASQIVAQHSDSFSKMIFIDSAPLTASSRSDLGTYFDITPTLRDFFASLSQAKSLNITPSMLSPNTKQGQCPDCLGLGYRTIDRAFYALETIPCSTCLGFRIQSLSREVIYQNKHFGQILQTPIQEILKIFPFLKKIQAPIHALMDMGLGYLQLGQPFSSLSISEKACIKIIKHLGIPPKQPSLFLLDELVAVLDQKQKIATYNLYLKLIHEGHSIVHIDNDLQFIQYADHLIELGPGAGNHGGKVIFSGDPQTYL